MKKWTRRVQDWKPINEKLLKININMFGRKIVVIGAYGHEDSPNMEKENFVEILQHKIQKVKNIKS